MAKLTKVRKALAAAFMALAVLAGALLLVGCDQLVDSIKDGDYTVTIAQSANGTITASANGIATTSQLSWPKDTLITIALEPDPGYRYKPGSLKANGNTISSTTPPYTFTLTSNVTITAEFEKLPEGEFSVTISPTIANGSIAVSQPSGPLETVITVTVSADPGYRYKAGSLKANDAPIPDDTPPYTFTLTEDVTIAAEFELLPEGNYNVTIAPAANGTVVAEPLYGPAGTDVVVTVTPASGYALDTLTYAQNGGSPQTIAGLTFKLPAANVTIAATFKTGDIDAFLKSGTEALEGKNYNLAVSSFEDAYRADSANPEAIVYSALGRLASIAVDANVKKLVQDRLGIKGYPGTIEALVSPDWMETYTDESLVEDYFDGNNWVYWFDKNDDSWFFDYYSLERKSGYYRSYYQDLLIPGETARRYEIESPYYDEQQDIYGYWYTAEDIEFYINYYDNYFDNTVSGYYSIRWDDELSKSISYLISDDPIYRLSDPINYYYDDNYYFYSWYDTANDVPQGYEGFVGPGYYRYNGLYGWELVSEVLRYDVNTSPLPGMEIPSWFANTNMYNDSFSAGTHLQSSTTYMWLMMANLADKNPDGLNNLLDDLLSSVFGNAFEEAYSRIADLADEVKLSEKTLEAFGLKGIFEGDVYIGKAELNILFAAMRVVKASLQWVASYDWNTDISFLKNGGL